VNDPGATRTPGCPPGLLGLHRTSAKVVAVSQIGGAMWSLGGVNLLTSSGTVAWCFAFDESNAVKIGS